MIEINSMEFASGNHTLTITFTDVNGNTGSSRYLFLGQTREGEDKRGMLACNVVIPPFLQPCP